MTASNENVFALFEAVATANADRPFKRVVVDELPRNAMGKAQKAELRAATKDRS